MFPRGRSTSKRLSVMALVLTMGACAALGLAACDAPDRPTTAKVIVDGIELTVEVADTVRERARGLQGRPQPDDDAGMLFVWEDAGPRAFGIEDVPYDLDVIFMDADGVVTEVLPLSPTGPYRAEADGMAGWVLEVRGGWAEAHGVGPGSRFTMIGD